MGCCIAPVPFRQVGLLQIPLREVLDVHYLVQADGEPLSPDFPQVPPALLQDRLAGGCWQVCPFGLSHMRIHARKEKLMDFRQKRPSRPSEAKSTVRERSEFVRNQSNGGLCCHDRHDCRGSCVIERIHTCDCRADLCVT